MPVEIRELVIKTTLETGVADRQERTRLAEIQALRRDMLEECERLLRSAQGRNRFER
ncbi:MULTISPECIES: DUF5908 family protein [unclassified Azospirillum]|uniref:DUF5908 family protein n=1 Tax=unclassified Azospirillum TaxID=2630922 RepID=UPI000B6C73B0|nr:MULTISPECIES: DUF5908 family protein [unclassified Azospirillum]SNS81109.1 hypothetical protein SAMN05880556_11277 [Azospirillum sp. RU38E]SNS98218.1 hypothetical protein SAMN05880591_11277 [Azospirillum sp. RU37A]